jgi:hypothetical protein
LKALPPFFYTLPSRLISPYFVVMDSYIVAISAAAEASGNDSRPQEEAGTSLEMGDSQREALEHHAEDRVIPDHYSICLFGACSSWG